MSTGMRASHRPTALRRRLRWIGLLLVAALLPGPPSARADEPIMTIAKNMLLGGATGMILGGTLTLVVDEDQRGEVVRWGVVIGTFAGFALGTALALRGDEDLLSAAPTPKRLPPPEAGHPRAGPPLPGAAGGGWGLRIAVLRLAW